MVGSRPRQGPAGGTRGGVEPNGRRHRGAPARLETRAPRRRAPASHGTQPDRSTRPFCGHRHRRRRPGRPSRQRHRQLQSGRMDAGTRVRRQGGHGLGLRAALRRAAHGRLQFRTPRHGQGREAGDGDGRHSSGIRAASRARSLPRDHAGGSRAGAGSPGSPAARARETLGRTLGRGAPRPRRFSPAARPRHGGHRGFPDGKKGGAGRASGGQCPGHAGTPT